MVKYKITYWLAGNIKVAYVKASSIYEAKLLFYVTHVCEDIIEVVEEDVQ